MSAPESKIESLTPSQEKALLAAFDDFLHKDHDMLTKIRLSLLELTVDYLDKKAEKRVAFQKKDTLLYHVQLIDQVFQSVAA